MGADNGRHEVGDIVTPSNETGLFSRRKRRVPKGLKRGGHYKIISINRGIDGAYDWDDIYLEGKPGMYCEFDLDTVSRE